MNTQSPHSRVVVITGASSGIGEATARRARPPQGYRLALLARRVQPHHRPGRRARLRRAPDARPANVTDRDSLVARPPSRVQAELGGADVLINAGVMLLGPFSSQQRAEFRQMIEVNLLGAITASEVFLDQLRDGGGDLVNISLVEPDAPPPATACTPRRSGSSTAGLSRCVRNSSPECA